MSFAYPLAWLVLVAFILAQWLLGNLRTHIYVPDIALVRRGKKPYWLEIVKFIGIICIVCALSKPLWQTKNLLIPLTQSQIALVLDTSFSMEAVDFSHSGENRLEVLKRLSKEFIDKNPYDSMLIVAFGEHTIVLNALTQDRGFLHYVIDNLTLGLAGGKTAINNALVRTIYALTEFEGREDFQTFVDKQTNDKIQRSIILLTDGFDTDSNISTTEMMDLALKSGVKIYPINISDGGDMQSLDFIAKTSGGKAFSAIDESELAKVYEQIGELTPHTIMKPYGYDMSIFVLGLGIILLLVWSVGYFELWQKRQ
ncbi:VWA domain-containing protein [uncultured Helicobacter sp.]|uniref:VWA domain-containing protein n=1 Tax=uncultured Helicobacter sp. TaxID=175537 RepID=UPI001C3A348B|nr:VWA domain-containing protein [Candidatus Helicobacter avicola]